MRQNDERLGVPDPPAIPQTGGGLLNYVIPTEIVDLPSKGLLYPPSHPLHDKEYVEIKQMTAKEEDILTSTTLINKGIVLEHLIQSLLLDKNINVKTLFSGDKNAIVLNARIHAYGPEYKVSSFCTECSANSELIFDLTEVKNKEIEYNDGYTTVELPKTKFTTKVKYLTSHEETILLKEVEKKVKMGFSDCAVTTLLKFIIVSVDGISASENDVSHFIENMPAADAKHIKEHYEKTKPDVDLSFEAVCEACSHTERRAVPITAQFFWPNS